jgi:hypothetical protein
MSDTIGFDVTVPNQEAPDAPDTSLSRGSTDGSLAREFEEPAGEVSGERGDAPHGLTAGPAQPDRRTRSDDPGRLGEAVIAVFLRALLDALRGLRLDDYVGTAVAVLLGVQEALEHPGTRAEAEKAGLLKMGAFAGVEVPRLDQAFAAIYSAARRSGDDPPTTDGAGSRSATETSSGAVASLLALQVMAQWWNEPLHELRYDAACAPRLFSMATAAGRASVMDLPVEPAVAAVLPQLIADLGSDYIDAYRKVLSAIVADMRSETKHLVVPRPAAVGGDE